MTLRAGALTGLLNQPTAQVIDGSLSFKPTGNGSGSERLNRTPSSSGNRRTWTWSAWVKRGSRFSGTNETHLLDSRVNDDDRFYGIAFAGPNDGEFLFVWEEYSAGNYYYHKATPSLRDNGWYHLVVTVDTTQPNGIDRVRFYANGKPLPVAAEDGTYGWYAEDFETNVNQASSTHFIGSFNGARNFDGYMCQNYLIDGLALGPSYFGFTDPLTGTWRPKKLKQGDPTINDGTQWSSYLSDSSGASNLFDGDLTTFYGPGSSTETWTPAKPIEVVSQVRIYYSSGSTSRNFEVNDNGNVIATGTGTKWVDLHFTGSLRKISGTNGWNVGAIEIDGVTLVDSTTTTVDFGTNGFYLPMDNEDDFEKDKSGKGNDWTKTGFSGDSTNPDIVKDSPSGAVSGGRAQTGITTTSSAPANYATLNPLDELGLGNNPDIHEGNLRISDSSSYDITATMGVDRGRWYWEVEMVDVGTTICGIVDIYNSRSSQFSMTSPTVYYATTRMNGTREGNQSGGTNFTYTDGDIVAWALDVDNLKLYGYKNGSLESTATITQSDITWTPYVYGESTTDHRFNFGQKPFKYAPPQGFLPLNSASARPNTVITRPDQYVGIITYVGDDASSHSITGLNFNATPDFVWIKNRDQSEKHILHDTVRGVGDTLYSTAEQASDTGSTYSDRYKSFDFNGFTVGSTHTSTNSDGDNFVAWCWKAGGAPTATNDNTSGAMDANSVSIDGVLQSAYTPSGSPSVYPNKMSIGTKQGFSIVTWSRSSSTDSIPHGLSQAPDLIIQKSTSASKRWQVGFSAIGWDRRLYLNLTDEDSDSTSFGYTDNFGPTDTLLRTGGTSYVAGDMIAYCWHNVPGLQKFGKYTGVNSKAKFVELGFRPAIVVIKFTQGTDVGSHAGWKVIDNQRNKFNPDGIAQKVAWDVLEAENGGTTISTSEGKVDFLSNGFRIRDNHSPFNTADRDYVYMAWAEAPFSNLFGGQSTAR